MNDIYVLDQVGLSEVVGGVATELKKRGEIIHIDELSLYQEPVLTGYRNLSTGGLGTKYTDWPKVLGGSKIDILNPATSPLNLIVALFGLEPRLNVDHIDATRAQANGFQLVDPKSERERMIKNLLWKKLIQESIRHGLEVLATAA